MLDKIINKLISFFFFYVYTNCSYNTFKNKICIYIEKKLKLHLIHFCEIILFDLQKIYTNIFSGPKL